jgi:hypothetical protein
VGDREQRIGSREGLSREVPRQLNAITAFLTALDTWEAADSSLNKALREDARKAAENAIEHFAAHQVRYNEKMSETEKLDLLGVRTWHPGHPINVPGTVPELSPSRPPGPLSLTAS